MSSCWKKRQGSLSWPMSLRTSLLAASLTVSPGSTFPPKPIRRPTPNLKQKKRMKSPSAMRLIMLMADCATLPPTDGISTFGNEVAWKDAAPAHPLFFQPRNTPDPLRTTARV